MGTETSLVNSAIFIRSCNLVKLNNPLMGTETERVVPIENLYQMWSVKLNNPLMGTETGHLAHSNRFSDHKC